jgi:CheY-like chemotaxis protein/glycine cleavage system H lipoate-binding protein
MQYVLIAVIILVIVDLSVRLIFKKFQEKKFKKQREEALKKSKILDFSKEAKTLKQAIVENPKAKILCVDDEEIILDSFRKILVLDGYSVDTVESGPEALHMIKSHHYDFVFTDLKMPEMNGIEVTKAVKEIRPDIDVVIITGYATVESAVECMKYGALDYVQKPFTEDELLQFAQKSLSLRQEKIKDSLKPRVHITGKTEKEHMDEEEFAIPGGVFISSGHTWISLEPNGLVRIGIDDFAKKAIGTIDDIEFPNLGMMAKKGLVLFSVKRSDQTIPFNSPVNGKVAKVNKQLIQNLEELDITTYDKNWICYIDANDLDLDIQDMKIGKSVIPFYQRDIEKFRALIFELLKNKQIEQQYEKGLSGNKLEQLSDEDWDKIISTFFQK